MPLVVLLLFVVIPLVLFSCYFIARRVYKSLHNETKNNALLLSVVVFILSLTVITLAIFYLVLDNIRIER